MTAAFGEQERAVLAGLADVLIPQGEDMPSASQAGVAAEQLDAVLVARWDLVEDVRNLVERAAGRDPGEFVAELRAGDPDAFGVLATVVPGGYFLSQQVRARIGYQGQRAVPIRTKGTPDYLEDGLLQSVIDRGPIFRPTPAT